ncbi:MAG: hypothetical protein H0W86_01460 [Armatimonadetes bacterium]|nr:hypothetical protein [Armatimonadota bacterium]
MKRTKFIVALAALLAFALAPAQEKPSAEMERIAWMLGDWSGKVKWSIKGMNETVDMPYKAVMEGNFMKSTSSFQMMGMSFSEMSYLCWDSAKKRYSSYTFTKFAPTPRIEHGTLEGDKMVMISEPWTVEGPMTSRATITKKSDKEVHFLIEFKEGDKWVKTAEGTFTKK